SPRGAVLSSNEPIDESVILKLRTDYGDEDGSLLVGLIEAFVDETRILQQATQVTENAEAGLRLAQVAHRLKSAAATLGARNVVRLCQALEVAERAGDKTSSSTALAGLMPAIVRARASLARIAKATESAKGA
ncbi:MAG TPA: Hpt domain-containing protein, partial [Polyangiales bacterium]|nr:Hpt domain-containing protein [Polyangiales bacterium]